MNSSIAFLQSPLRGACVPLPPPGTVTNLLHHWNNPVVRGQLFSLIYPELKSMAAARLAKESHQTLLQPTALVHELFLKMVKQQDCEWASRSHFLAAASSSMRHLLVDQARADRSIKRGGHIDWLKLDAEQFATSPNLEQALVLDDLLNTFAQQDPRAAQVVEMRCFGGLTFEETAKLLDIHPRTAKRDWRIAIAWFNSSFARESGA